jgi:hypothetical protein
MVRGIHMTKQLVGNVKSTMGAPPRIAAGPLTALIDCYAQRLIETTDEDEAVNINESIEWLVVLSGPSNPGQCRVQSRLLISELVMSLCFLDRSQSRRGGDGNHISEKEQDSFPYDLQCPKPWADVSSDDKERLREELRDLYDELLKDECDCWRVSGVNGADQRMIPSKRKLTEEDNISMNADLEQLEAACDFDLSTIEDFQCLVQEKLTNWSKTLLTTPMDFVTKYEKEYTPDPGSSDQNAIAESLSPEQRREKRNKQQTKESAASPSQRSAEQQQPMDDNSSTSSEEDDDEVDGSYKSQNFPTQANVVPEGDCGEKQTTTKFSHNERLVLTHAARLTSACMILIFFAMLCSVELYHHIIVI